MQQGQQPHLGLKRLDPDHLGLRAPRRIGKSDIRHDQCRRKPDREVHLTIQVQFATRGVFDHACNARLEFVIIIDSQEYIDRDHQGDDQNNTSSCNPFQTH